MPPRSNVRPVKLVWKLAVFTGLSLVAYATTMIAGAIVEIATGWGDVTTCAVPLLAAGGVLLVSWLCLRWFDRETLAGIRMQPTWRAITTCTAGLLLGAGLIAACWLALVATGRASSSLNPALSSQGPSLLQMACLFVGVGFFEELIWRGYPLQMMARWNRPTAVAMMGIAFAAVHLDQAGALRPLPVTNLLLAHLLLVTLLLRWSLWCAIGFHIGWNFSLSGVFGLSVSGRTAGASVLQTTAQPGLWTGNEFGPEGGLCITVLLTATLLVIGSPLLRRRHRIAPGESELVTGTVADAQN